MACWTPWPSTFTAPASLALGNQITTNGGEILFGTAVLGHDATITSNGGTIQFGGAVTDSGGGHDLTLDAGGGLIALLDGAGKSTGPQLGDLLTDTTGTTNFGESVYAASVTVDSGGMLDVHGAIKTTGTQTYNEPVTLTATVALTSHNALIHFSGGTTTVDSLSGKIYGLTANAGTGDITFDAGLGDSNALGAVSLTSKGAVTLSGDAMSSTFTLSAPHFTVQDVTTSGKQTYSGIGTFDGALSGTTLTLTSTGNVTNTASWDFTGKTTIKGSAISLTAGSNDFASLVLTGASADIHELGAIAFGAVTLSGDLDLTAGGDITQASGAVHVAGLSASTTGAVDLNGTTNVINKIDAPGVTAGGAITILTGGTGLGIYGDLTATAGDIILAADMGSSTGEFSNHAGANPLHVSGSYVFDIFSYSELHTTLTGFSGAPPFSFSNLVTGHRYPTGAPSIGNEVIYVKR